MEWKRKALIWKKDGQDERQEWQVWKNGRQDEQAMQQIVGPPVPRSGEGVSCTCLYSHSPHFNSKHNKNSRIVNIIISLAWALGKRRQLFFEFLIGNAEKGTYDKGYIGMGKKHLFPHEDPVISMLVTKLMVTQEQKCLSPKGVGWGIGRIQDKGKKTPKY